MGIFQGAQELGSGERAHGQGYYRATLESGLGSQQNFDF